MTFLGGLITTLGDSGRLGLECWATEFAQPAVLSRLRLDLTISKSSTCNPDALELPFVSSMSMRLCSLSASAFFLSFSSSRSCCRKNALTVLLDKVSIVTPNNAEIYKLSGAIFLLYLVIFMVCLLNRFCVDFI